MKKLICIFILLLITFIFTLPHEVKKEEISKEEVSIKESVVETSTLKTVKLLNNDKVINIDLETYIVGVVACEMPASFHEESLKSQAVASRTYALSNMNGSNTYDLENSTNDQCYIDEVEMQEKWGNSYDKYYDKIKSAVSNTKGEYMTYDGKIIRSYYFSTSNGYTENSESVFGECKDYLVSVSSLWDKEVSSYEKETVFTEVEFLNKLELDLPLTNIEVNERSETGRINFITVNEKKFKGTTFRQKLGIRSTDADIVNKDGNVIITTRGYGHGVGMSQYGANGMANEGYGYKEILKYYYKNIEINNV